MNLSTEWGALIVEAGHEATHWSAIGPSNAGDDELLGRARADSAGILTNDLEMRDHVEKIARGALVTIDFYPTRIPLLDLGQDAK